VAPTPGPGAPDSDGASPRAFWSLPAGKRLIRGSLVLADITLVGLVVAYVVTTRHHFGLLETAVCVLAMGLGAWLACLALWLE
jgi:hypothetical protein